jgi:hypothetical protein
MNRRVTTAAAVHTGLQKAYTIAVCTYVIYKLQCSAALAAIAATAIVAAAVQLLLLTALLHLCLCLAAALHAKALCLHQQA